MIKRLLYVALVFGVSFVMLSFSGGGGFWKVEKSESFLEKKDDVRNKEIIFFAPEIMSLSVSKTVDRNFLTRGKLSESARKAMKWSWKKSGIKAVFVDENNGKYMSFEQHQRVLALRKEIIKSNNLQNHPLDDYRINYSDITQSIFVNTPKIDFGYGDLADLKGSPYFALTGFFEYNIKPKNSSMRNYVNQNDIRGWGNFHYYYCIIVDVESGEIIYREFKKIPLKLNAKTIKGFLYESYYVLNKNLKS